MVALPDPSTYLHLHTHDSLHCLPLSVQRACPFHLSAQTYLFAGIESATHKAGDAAQLCMWGNTVVSDDMKQNADSILGLVRCWRDGLLRNATTFSNCAVDITNESQMRAIGNRMAFDPKFLEEYQKLLTNLKRNGDPERALANQLFKKLLLVRAPSVVAAQPMARAADRPVCVYARACVGACVQQGPCRFSAPQRMTASSVDLLTDAVVSDAGLSQIHQASTMLKAWKHTDSAKQIRGLLYQVLIPLMPVGDQKPAGKTNAMYPHRNTTGPLGMPYLQMSMLPDPDIIEPLTGSYMETFDMVEALLVPWTETVLQKRGGIEGRYSKLVTIPDYLEGCPPLVTDLPASRLRKWKLDGGWKTYAYPPQKRVKNIRILADGLDGSAGSMLPTTAYAYGLASVVTYGGIHGQPMDLSAFNGGNKNMWDDFWVEGSTSSYFYHALFGTQTCEGTTEVRCPWAQYLPLLGGLKGSYTQTSHVLADQTGEGSLWREWYTIPASHHLDVWPKADIGMPLLACLDQKSCAAMIHTEPWEELLAVYRMAVTTPPKYFHCARGSVGQTPKSADSSRLSTLRFPKRRGSTLVPAEA